MSAHKLAELVRLALLRILTRRMIERTGPEPSRDIEAILEKVPGGSWRQ